MIGNAVVVNEQICWVRSPGYFRAYNTNDKLRHLEMNAAGVVLEVFSHFI